MEETSPWRTGGYKCPRCGYELTIPLRPSDAKTQKVWTLYCPRCGFTWALGKPLEDII
ncbi:MAG: transposase [Aigarchaeota archaeon]|nr:transposase [Candidatus Pelearchaeum maunauluense]